MAAINNIGKIGQNSYILVFQVTAGHSLLDGYSEDGGIVFLRNFNTHTLISTLWIFIAVKTSNLRSYLFYEYTRQRVPDSSRKNNAYSLCYVFRK
jgi:hypothetical protein